MRHRYKRKILIFGLMSAAIYIGLSMTNYSDKRQSDVDYQQNQVCVHPKLNPFEGAYFRHFHSVDRIKCSEDEDWIATTNGTVFISPTAIKKHGKIECTLTYFERIDDFKNKDFTNISLKEGIILPLEHDFFKAKCTSVKGKTYHNVHAGIRYHAEYHNKITDLQSGLGLDVLMLGFDSLSHMTYIRKLKKTYKYFTENLKGIVLNGYNIVGDGTVHALLPILTGKTELELPRTLKRLAKKEFVDVYPMVWKDFRQKGYVTVFAEDIASLGTFTFRMVGFKDSPTDHYMRPFHVTAENEFYKKHKKLCLGSKRRSEVFMNWIKDVYSMYDKVPKFVFGFHNEVSHEDNNYAETADEDLYNLLKYLNDGNFLRKTIVILMSDHGARFSKFRSSLQGKQEERLPFFGFAFPESFKTQKNKSFKNFQTNVDRLTCPFDMYPTFIDMLTFNGGGIGNKTNRGISLFDEIPKARACKDAGIATHWCACLKWQNMNVSNNDEVKSVAEYVISKINKLTEPHRTLCEQLNIKSILRAQKLLPETNLLHYKQSKDADSLVADLSGETKIDNIVYIVWIYTKPGDGLFEVTVTHDIHKKSFSLNEQSISRANKYGNAPKCIETEHGELRKYCYCKSQ